MDGVIGRISSLVTEVIFETNRLDIIVREMEAAAERRRMQRRVRRFWIHPINELRMTRGVQSTLYLELRCNPQKFYNYVRMKMEHFDYLIGKLEEVIQRQDTRMRLAITPAERLLVTLCFLATGESLTSLHFQFRLGISTIGGIVKDTFRAIWDTLQPEYIPQPTMEIWLRSSEQFERICNFPNCVGAVDGKHIRIAKPAGTGSEYYNYKKYFSIVLMAIADANCRFLAVDIGAYGRSNDSQVFKNSPMGRCLYGDTYNFPPARPLPGTSEPAMPYVCVGDEAFQLSPHLLKPYSSRELHRTKQVHGQCICKHNTAGPHCEQCAPLYNDRAWKAANGKTGEPNMCEKCKCNDHADSCRFDMDVWLASGNQSGGACNNCQHNTEGIHCEKCAPGFFRDLKIPFSAPDACKACSCHPVGSAKLSFSNHTLCDPQNGNCPCKPGVAGPICDRCMVGYWGFGEYGCRPCACPGNCDSFTGDCITNLEVDWYHGPDFLSSEQGFSALRHSGKCECKDQVLENAKVFCDMRYSYVLKVKILSAHDKGSHAEVIVKIKKVLKMTKLKIPRGKRILYPESWTNRGCTCPILNPGLEYLVAGYEDVRTGHLIVNMKSFVQPWKPSIGKKVMEILSKDCY
ncbi:netrin-4 isoform X1 [Ranitomeya imitator]|uniref:netrin-4 isoform X1 n=1 Tax=Ranitomeya imitator TaxID=111125 RepID=UPI0037E7FCF6